MPNTRSGKVAFTKIQDFGTNISNIIQFDLVLVSAALRSISQFFLEKTRFFQRALNSP